MQGAVTGSGYVQCCRFFCLPDHTCLSKLCDISKTLCYLRILRRDSDSQNFPLAKLQGAVNLAYLTATFIDCFFCCFLDNHSRFPPELLLLCSLIKMYMLPLADLICGNSIKFCRYDINFLFSQTIFIPVFYKG